MYPDLSYVWADWFHAPADSGWSVIKTYGLFLVMAFFAAALVFRSELRHREVLGQLTGRVIQSSSGSTSWVDVIMNSLLAFIIGFKLFYVLRFFDETRSDPIGVLISTKGDTTAGFILGLAVAFFLLYKKYALDKEGPVVSKTVMPSDHVASITLISAICGLIGSKIFVFIQSRESWNAFLEAPIEHLISGSGMAIYGGIIVALGAGFLYARLSKIPVIKMLDAAAPALMMGYCIGRLGCHFAGDGDWGIVNVASPPDWWFFPDWLWAYDYPNTVLTSLRESADNALVTIPDCSGYVTADGGAPKHCLKLDKPVWPTSVYESIFAFIAFLILRSLSTRLRIPGLLISIYFILNGMERFTIEKIRVNEKLDFLGWQATQAELIAVLFVVAGTLGLLYFSSRGRSRQSTSSLDN